LNSQKKTKVNDKLLTPV